MYIYLYIYLSIYLSIYLYIYIYIHIYIYTYIYIWLCIWNIKYNRQLPKSRAVLRWQCLGGKLNVEVVSWKRRLAGTNLFLLNSYYPYWKDFQSTSKASWHSSKVALTIRTALRYTEPLPELNVFSFHELDKSVFLKILLSTRIFLSSFRPIHNSWFVEFYYIYFISVKTDLVPKSWNKTYLLTCFGLNFILIMR